MAPFTARWYTILFMITIKNQYLRLDLDSRTGVWSLTPARQAETALEGARIGVAFRAGGKPIGWLLSEIRGKPAARARKDALQGACRTLVVKADAGHGLAVLIEWSLPLRRPFLLWRVILTNRSDQPLYIDSVDLCRAGPRFDAGGGLRLPILPADRAMFVNGWQTWSFAGGLKSRDRQPGPKLGPINSAMHTGTHRRPTGAPGHFVSDMFAVIGAQTGPDQLAAGYLAQCEQFGFVETWLGDDSLSLRMQADADGVRLDPGRTLRTDRAFLASGEKASAEGFFDAAARENRARVRRPAPEGWSSWYYYYTAITQADLEKNTDAAQALKPRLPLRLIQLDDGFQAGVGDWFDRSAKFPSPMSDISARIRKAGFTPGVWLSPFLIQTNARLAKDHPDWLAPRAQGVMSNVKPAWVRETRSLDVTRLEAADHVRRLIRTAVREWKFPFLKLDYLYLPAVKGARLADPTVTRAQALRKALGRIRAAAGEKTFLLGCGCPLGSGIGIFDAMRIGPDVDSIWKPHLFHQTWAGRGDPTLPAAWNAVRNMLARAPLHRRWWWNDPDCLLARDANTRLTPAERRTLAAAIALSGGMVLLSDDLSNLSPEALRLAQILFPPLYRAADQRLWRSEPASSISVLSLRGPQGDWRVVGIFNWSGRPVDRLVDLSGLTGWQGELIVSSFWEEWIQATAGGRLALTRIPPHGSVLLAVRPKTKAVQYAGSNLHFSQGAEVAEWKPSRNGLHAVVNLKREAEGAVWLALPGKPCTALLDGRPVIPGPAGGDIWKFPVQIKKKGVLEVRWK
jgi:alpha-galactosidase